jgi:hypothetical protein
MLVMCIYVGRKSSYQPESRLDPINNQVSHVFTFLVSCCVAASESCHVDAPIT